MLKLYARLAGKSIRLALRGWPAAVVLPIYATILAMGTLRFGQDLLGGFLVSIGVALLISSYLHLISLAVAGRKIGFGDLRDSFLAHFLDVISVLFVTWLIQYAVAGATHDMGERGKIVFILVDLLMVVFFNPVPELIYLAGGQVRSIGLLMESGRFISAHWPEWLGPTVLMAAVVLAPAGMIHRGPAAEMLLTLQQVFSLNGLALAILRIPLWLAPVMMLFISWAMVFRGLLFLELSSRVRRPRSWP
jgi:hypothetical protein